jgi:Tfp pilus assembly protein PilX
MVFACVLAALAAYFIRHAFMESKLASRSFFQSAALNLAEAGIDEAMLDINNAAIGTGLGWRQATDNAASWVKHIDGTGQPAYALGEGTGSIFVRVDNWTANTTGEVTVTTVGQVTFASGAPVNRQLVVKVKKRAAQGAGVLAKNGVTFKGNVVIDAYNSALGVPNATTNRSDQVIVATTSATADVTLGGNAQVYGYVATGGTPPTVGTNGRIYGPTTGSGVKVDPTRVRNDFAENIPEPVGPTGTAINLGSISTSLTLPRAGDTPQANGRYLYTDGTGGLQLNGGATLTITGPVDLILTEDLHVGNSGRILLSTAGGAEPSMNVYAYGDVNLGGDGLNNMTNVPAKANLYVMGTEDVQVNCNADLTGMIYAPNSTVHFNGNGNVNGAVVGASVKFNGNTLLHYDTQLGSTAASPYYAVKSWVELTDAAATGLPFQRDRRDPFTFL